jgi:hypothetical protein
MRVAADHHHPIYYARSYYISYLASNAGPRVPGCAAPRSHVQPRPLIDGPHLYHPWTASPPMLTPLSSSILSLLIMASQCTYALDSSKMEQHLSAGTPLLGTFAQSSDKLASWMSGFGDDATIESLSIPGTHDSLACGFSPDERWVFTNGRRLRW